MWTYRLDWRGFLAGRDARERRKLALTIMQAGELWGGVVAAAVDRVMSLMETQIQQFVCVAIHKAVCWAQACDTLLGSLSLV